MSAPVVVAYCAADSGPRETLQTLAAHLPGPWLESFRDQAEAAAILESKAVALLVAGTSDSPAGVQREGQARRAANAGGLPCVVVEDYAGNYTDVPSAPPSTIIVDCEPAKGWARKKTPSPQTSIHVCPSIRYDPLRRRLAELRQPRTSANAVLWIGQPETEDALATLARVAPELRRRKVPLWFRAHPRDAGYKTGAYRDVLAGAEDLTQVPLEACFSRAPRLVVTQFSSVAIEAGFWGIPALHAVFADVGGARLMAKKGYAVPPWCEAGAAFAVTDRARVAETLDLALSSEQSRNAVIAGFDDWFSVSEEVGPRLVKLLYNQGLFQRRRPR
jgi:hypothetical protein